MKKYINTSNYYLSTITSKIENTGTSWSFDVSDTSVDWVILPTQWYFWVDVDFGDASKREIFRIVSRDWYTLTYDARISPYGMKTHSIWASVWLRDFSQLLNSLSANTDNFWEVEKTWDLTVLVRWGKVFATGNATKIYTTADTSLSVPINSTKYIVLDYELSNDWIDLAAFVAVDAEDLTATGKYPIARVVSNANMITSIEDLRSTVVYGWWEWDMKAGIYDPNNHKTNAFHMDNMEQWEINQYVSPVEKQYWSDKQEELIGQWVWQNIHTINWQNILWPGNFSLDTVLTVWWAYEVTEEWASYHQISADHNPVNESSFMIITDSGTFLVNWVDYSYNEVNRTITFTNPLASTEKAYIWVMYNVSEWETEIWCWDITIKNWEKTIGIFNVNQDTDTTIDIQQDVLITKNWYDALPDSKLTDDKWYYIYS